MRAFSRLFYFTLLCKNGRLSLDGKIIIITFEDYTQDYV